MISPIHPDANQVINKLIQDDTGQLSTYPFPENIAGKIPKELRQRIFRWMLNNYIWPQVQERQPYEAQWDRLLHMARAELKLRGQEVEPGTRLARKLDETNRAVKRLDDDQSTIGQRIDVSDTVVYDAIDRLTNLNHFISFKEMLPVRYEIPEDMIFPYENEVYSPMSDLVRSANCWLKFNSQNNDVYRKGWMASRHHYTYGVSFVDSQFYQKIEQIQRRGPNKQFVNQLELTDIGITFEPMSLRKLWLNPRLSVYKMDYQPCPFFFEEVPRFAIVANPYDPQQKPFGFANTENLPAAQYLFGTQELDSWSKAWGDKHGNVSPLGLMKPELNVELLWTYYAMLPLGIDPSAQTEENPGGIVLDDTGELGIPLTRWITQSFGNNLCSGEQELVRLQRNFYPGDSLPLYGSAHMPTLDDGTYPMSIGSVLENHYIQLCKCMMQYIENKDWVNDPPHFITSSSPAMAHDLNKKGAKIPVLTQNDVNSRQPYDATQTTPAVMGVIRGQAQTSSKAVDAIIGKAMGSRTSATEASNVYQTAMSGVTTDINLFAYDIYGGYATRVWTYTGRWVDPDVLAAITGSYGFAIKPEHMVLRLGLKWDIGSSFIESITRQSNYRYLLESSQPGDPSVNRPYLMRALLKEWKMKDVDRIINDGGMEDQIQLATEQAIQTYMGQMVMIDPDQDHNTAIRIIKSFLQDRNSVWNTTPEYVRFAPKLVQMIQQHQLFLQLQMLQMQLQQQRQMLGQGDAFDSADPNADKMQQQQQAASQKLQNIATTAGQARQQTGQ